MQQHEARWAREVVRAPDGPRPASPATPPLLNRIVRALEDIDCALRASTIDTGAHRILSADGTDIGSVRVRGRRVTYVAVGSTVILASTQTTGVVAVRRLIQTIERGRYLAD